MDVVGSVVAFLKLAGVKTEIELELDDGLALVLVLVVDCPWTNWS